MRPKLSFSAAFSRIFAATGFGAMIYRTALNLVKHDSESICAFHSICAVNFHAHICGVLRVRHGVIASPSTACRPAPRSPLGQSYIDRSLSNRSRPLKACSCDGSMDLPRVSIQSLTGRSLSRSITRLKRHRTWYEANLLLRDFYFNFDEKHGGLKCIAPFPNLKCRDRRTYPSAYIHASWGIVIDTVVNHP